MYLSYGNKAIDLEPYFKGEDIYEMDESQYYSHHMIQIAGGAETIRHYQDKQKWISSDYRMSNPGRLNNMNETINTVEIQPFFIARYPVTQGLYHAFTKKETLGSSLATPMVNVSWLDAIDFCNLLSGELNLPEYYSIDHENGTVVRIESSNGYRLPTDAEWQYACKAGTTGYRYGNIEDIAWYRDNSGNRIHEVGEKQPNSWGLYDMLGNVWEWCWDLYDEETYGSYRIFRGGSWAQEARGCGATCRRRSMPTFAIDDLGFRVARNP